MPPEKPPSLIRFLRFPALVLVLSILVFYLHKNDLLSETPLKPYVEKATKSLSESWSNFWLSGRLIYRRLLSSRPRLDTVRDQLLAEERKFSVRNDTKIAIGLGICTDIVVDALDVFGQLNAPNVIVPHDVIETWDQLLELFAFYFRHGAAAERYIKTKSVYQKLIELMNRSGIRKKEVIGGNAALMSLRFAREGIENILLGAQITAKLAKKFPTNIKISGPLIDQDDYHVMLEYKTNQRWGQYVSPRSNRLIVHSDDNNVKLLARSNFFQQIMEFRPNMLVITGLHMLDGSPLDFDVRSQAIQQLAEDLTKLESGEQKPRAHFEMGSYTENLLLDSVVNQIFPHMDSFGMNEQEVFNLLSFVKYGNISHAANPFPRIAQVLDEMRELFALLEMIGNGRVSRIHVHTLAYQVVMVRLDGKTFRPMWPASAAAMAKAALTAYRYTCNTNDIDLLRANILVDDSFSTSSNSDKRKRIPLDYAVKCWTETLGGEENSTRVQICLAAGMVCTEVVQTGGAGDNVSAAGMVLQI